MIMLLSFTLKVISFKPYIVTTPLSYETSSSAISFCSSPSPFSPFSPFENCSPLAVCTMLLNIKDFFVSSKFCFKSFLNRSNSSAPAASDCSCLLIPPSARYKLLFSSAAELYLPLPVSTFVFASSSFFGDDIAARSILPSSVVSMDTSLPDVMVIPSSSNLILISVSSSSSYFFLVSVTINDEDVKRIILSLFVRTFSSGLL